MKTCFSQKHCSVKDRSEAGLEGGRGGGRGSSGSYCNSPSEKQGGLAHGMTVGMERRVWNQP